MNGNLARLDSEVFAHTASIFSTKRVTLAPEAVEAVASDIVRRLAQSTTRLPFYDISAISEKSVAEFCDALILPDADAALRFIEDRRAEGMSLPGVYLGYISGGGRCLGERGKGTSYRSCRSRAAPDTSMR